MSRRVLFVVTCLFIPGHPDSTGGTISNYLMLTAMAKMCDLSILLLGTRATELDDLPGAQVVRSPSPAWRGAALLACWNPYVQGATREAIAAHGPFDAIIGSTDTVPALVPAVTGNASRGVIVQAFENFGPYAPGVTTTTRISVTKQMILRRFVDARVIRSARVIGTNSQYMCKAIQDRFGCTERQLHIVTQQCDFNPKCPNPPARNVVGFVNRNADKNPQFVAELAARMPDVEFLVYGKKYHLSGSPPNLRSVGWSNSRQSMFASARVWIVPSLWPEPFGRVSIEAQAANRTVLVRAVGGLPETVVDPKFALQSFDHGLWEKSIRTALATPEDQVAENGARIREKFSATAHNRSVKALLTKLIPA